MMPKTETELILRNLEALLRKTVCDDVTVVKYETINFLPKGENFAGTILKVDSVIKRTVDSPEENLPLVAKLIPSIEFDNSHFNSTIAFNKEMFFYEKLMPTFRVLEKEVGVKDKDLIDITPKYYGGRLTMNKEKPDVADEDAVVLMEDLTEHGYKIMDKKNGLDFDHAKLALEELARFHALSMAIKHKKPEFFETAKRVLNACPYEMVNNNIDDLVHQVISAICEDPRIDQYRDRIRTNAIAHKDWESIIKIEPIDPWISIIHGDFWVNNMMFKEENGQPKNVKFIDFQLTRVTSPTKDLPYFLLANVKLDVIDNHFDKLLDLYYNRLIKVLKIAGSDENLYTRKSFDEELKKDAKREFLRCIWVAKVFTEDFDDNQDLASMMNSIAISKVNKAYLERSWMIVSKFVEKEWI